MSESFSYYSKGDLKGALAIRNGSFVMDGRAVLILPSPRSQTSSMSVLKNQD